MNIKIFFVIMLLYTQSLIAMDKPAVPRLEFNRIRYYLTRPGVKRAPVFIVTSNSALPAQASFAQAPILLPSESESTSEQTDIRITSKKRKLPSEENPLSADRKPSCPACQKVLSNIARVQNHVAAVHLQLKPYKCAEADCTFASGFKTGLTHHLKKIHGKKGLPKLSLETQNIVTDRVNKFLTRFGWSHQCDECNKLFPTAQSRNLHRGKCQDLTKNEWRIL